MITKEDQVVSVDLAREMKELGAKQDSVWYWIQQGDYVDDWSEAFLILKEEKAHYDPTRDGDCSAYTVAELGEMLPASIRTVYDSWNYLHISKLKNTNEWLIAYWNDEIKSEKEADARAKMWVHLKKKRE